MSPPKTSRLAVTNFGHSTTEFWPPFQTLIDNSVPFIVATDTLRTWSSTFIDTLTAFIETHSEPESWYTPIEEFIRENSTASFTTLVATVLALLFFLLRFLMHRPSYSQGFYNGGRASPFYSHQPAHADRSISDLYSYVDEDDNIVGTGGHGRPSVALYEDDDAPDTIHIRYRAETFGVNFPPFSIAEEKVYVRDVREKVADALGIDYRRIRLVYKDHDLRRDNVPLRTYGCKQNSEIAVVITQELIDYSGHMSHSGSDSESAVSRRSEKQDQRRPRSNSTYRRRGDEPKPTPTVSNGFLHPTHAQATPSARPPRQPSPARQSTPQPTSKPAQPPDADSSTPLGKVQAIRYEWQSKLLPEVERFLAAPPPDKDDRIKEYRRLNETVYKKVFEAGDNIEAGGNDEVRSIRKACYSEAQAYLNKLDQYKA